MLSLSNIALVILSLVAAGLAFASLVGFLGRQWWIFDLFSHFRLQYAILAAVCGLGFLFVGQLYGLLWCLSLSLFNFAFIAPLYRPPGELQPDPQARTYRILTANILGSNGAYAPIIDVLSREQPDLALLVEYDHHHDEGLKELVQSYPQVFLFPRDDNYGLALLSRLPFDSSEVIFLNEDQIPVVVARMTLENHQVTIIGSHPPPPKRAQMTKIRDRQLIALARYAAGQVGEVILLGDFNTTCWSYSFQNLLRESKLGDSQLGFGIQPTWPVHIPLLGVPIDHILYSPGIHITARRTIKLSGSDHRVVAIDFILSGATS